MDFRPSPDDFRHFFVISNPVAGSRRRDRLEAAVAALRAQGATAEVHETRGRGHAQALATLARWRRDVDGVVGAGGDGTLNEIINGLAAPPPLPGEGWTPGHGPVHPPPLGLIPLGTANVLAAECDWPQTPHAIAQRLIHGCGQWIYPGLAGERRFALMVGVGLDAEVVAAIDQHGRALKRWLGKGAYALATLQCGLVRDNPRYTVELETSAGEACRISAAAVIVARSHFYGGRFVCAPEARLSRPQLHVCLFLRSGRLATLNYLIRLGIGRLRPDAGYAVLPTRHLILSGPEGAPVQSDGDLLGRLGVDPLVIGLAERPVRVFGPVADSGASS